MPKPNDVDTVTLDSIAFIIQGMEAEADCLREYTAAACFCLSRRMLIDAKNLYIIAVAEMTRQRAPLPGKIALFDCQEDQELPNTLSR